MTTSLERDVQNQINRLSKNGATDLKQELAFNVYPLLASFAAKLADLESGLDDIVEVMDESGNVIDQDLAAIIFTAFGAAQTLADEVKKLTVNDIVRKRLNGIIADLEAAIIVAAEGVTDAMPPDDQDEAEAEDAEDAEANPDDIDTVVTPAPIEPETEAKPESAKEGEQA